MTKSDYYTPEGEPIKCIHCEGTALKESVVDTIDGHTVCEFDVICESCKEIIAYWAFGFYDPMYMPDEEYMARKERMALQVEYKPDISTRRRGGL